MASSSLSYEQNTSSGIEPYHKRRKIDESSRQFDVFINHRGPDVKQTLAIQLYSSLQQLGIRPFLDPEENELGIFPVSSVIETAISSASVHIAIFSEGYAQSHWCLDELVLMLQSKAKIIPVFYQVEPWELRHIEKGEYAKAFTKYEREKRYLEKLQEWKEALQSVSFTTGYELNNSNSSDYKDIVSAVEKEVQRTKLLHVAKYPFGLHKLVKDFERQCLDKLVQDFESQCEMKKGTEQKGMVVGIFGMGGVGKTTLSKQLFNQKRSKYTRASFLFDVREAYGSGKLPSLQSKLLRDIFCEDNHSFLGSEEGASCLRDRLERSSSLSFLIVLDNIDHVEQLEALLVKHILNKSGNYLVIITTRDVGVLVSAGINIGYNLKGLDREEGRELFCLHAFRQPYPYSGYEDLVQDFIKVCGGLPLSLQVLGRHVSGRAQLYWQEELKKVLKTLPRDVKQRLKISFDTLDNVEKQIFIDIACFFIDKSITEAITIWKGSGWNAHHALETLKGKCLVEEVELRYVNGLEYVWESSADGSALRMHDHLRDLGREMANELSHPRRVWHPQHLKSLELKGFQNILAQTKGRCFHSILDKSMGCAIAYFLGETEDGSDTSLLWLQLEYLSFPPLHLNSDINSSIPLWIPLQNLQCLRIRNGCFKKLWQSDVQAPSHLKELQIRDTILEKFPNLLGKLNNMEKLVLHAKDIQMNIWSLLRSLRMNLRSLNMMGSAITGDLPYNDTAEGTTFKSLVIYDFKLLWEGEVALNNQGWSRAVMRNVEKLEINGHRLVTKILISGNCCQRLQSLKICEMENLIEADLAKIKTLNCLEITGCEKFKRLSATSDLSMLLELKISECLELEELRLAHLSCLEKITIQNCNHLKSVSGICNLAKLVELKISHCEKLEFEYLCLTGIKCLERITVDRHVKMKYFELDGCENLNTIKLGWANLVELNIQDCPELEKLQDFIGPSCLERITVDGCGNLKYLKFKGFENLKSVSGNFELRQLYIIDCPELDELPSVSRLSCLEQIEIDSCEKLQKIMLPTTLIRLSVRSCRGLQRVAGTADLTKLTQLYISECPELEELPNLSRMSFLEQIEIDSCEKLQNIKLPATLIRLSIRSCRDLQRVAGTGDLTQLTQLYVAECPELEELPCLDRLSCLEQIEVDSCEKLQNITLPTTVIRVSIRSCRELQRIAGTGDLTKLTHLHIAECPELDELPSLDRLSCLEQIEIDSCEKLQNIMLPTTLISLSVRSSRDFQRVAGSLTKLIQLYIADCPELEELPSLCRLIFLEQIGIESCEKLQNIMLPTTLINLSILSCRDLQRVAGIGDLTKLTQLYIVECPELVVLPSLDRLSCLEQIEIDSCEKLQNIMLPTTLIGLSLRSCRDLQRVAGTSYLTKLTQLYIAECPELEELPSLDRLSCMEQIEIASCEKLQNITLPTTLISLSIGSCRDLQRVAGTSYLRKLTQLYIAGCPELEELPGLDRLSCVEQIEIDSCEKLRNIILPTTLISLSVRSCRDLQRVAGTGDLTKLTRLYITDCAELKELPDLSRLSCLEQTEIDSCEKLQNITLPTTLIYLSIRSCKNLQRVAGTDDLRELVKFEISDCGKLEFEYLWHDKEHAPLQLRELIITGTWSASFERFPGSISYLNHLKKIALLGDVGKEFGIKGLPEEFCDLQSLEHLELRHCTLLSSLPARFGDLRNLLHLDLCTCKALRMLPVSFQQLTHLKYLDLSGCKRLVLQKDILEKVTKLQNLYLSGCLALQKLPHQITDQTCLRELRLHHTSLEDLPSNIGQLVKLEVLTVGSPLLKSLPDSFGNLSSLKRLSIIGCLALKSLPKTLGHLELLEDLCIETTGVRSLPEGFRQLANLQTLKISDCPLRELDFGLGSSSSLEKLTVININETLVTRISISERCCPRLETLRLSKNDYLDEIETLPSTVNNIELSECERLKNIKGIRALPILPNLEISDCPKELGEASEF